jgi:hypothetical protein
MAKAKVRLTVTVDPDLVEDGKRAVADGSAESLSAWVNQALAVHSKREQQLAGLREAIADYEAEFGKITEEEIAALEQRDRETAIVVNGPPYGSAAADDRSGTRAA